MVYFPFTQPEGLPLLSVLAPPFLPLGFVFPANDALQLTGDALLRFSMWK